MHVLLEAWDPKTATWWVVADYADEADLIQASRALTEHRLLHRTTPIRTELGP